MDFDIAKSGESIAQKNVAPLFAALLDKLAYKLQVLLNERSTVAGSVRRDYPSNMIAYPCIIRR